MSDPMDSYKIAVYIPEKYSQELMESVNSIIEPFYPGYDMCFSISKVIGTWRPLEGSKPFLGEQGRIERAEELKIEFIIRAEDVERVLTTILEVHPYEEPSIDVIPCHGWHDFVSDPRR